MPGLTVVVAGNLRQLLREILRGIVAVPGRVVEADAIGQGVVTEETLERAARQRIRPVVGAQVVRIRRATHAQAGAENVGARGDPLEPGLLEQFERGGADRPF